MTDPQSLHPDDEFDTPDDAERFRASLCPNCEGFGEIYETDEASEPTRCPACHGTGTRVPLPEPR